MTISLNGPWSLHEIGDYLQGARIPIRIACTGLDGFPRVVSVWFVYSGGSLLCASHQDSQLVKLLRKSPRVGFEISCNEPPYFGVRGQGLAAVSDSGGGEVLSQLIERYLGGSNSGLASWLLSRSDEEVLITVSPARFFSWDYRDRMQSSAKA